mgnify:CR=1 FL=1
MLEDANFEELPPTSDNKVCLEKLVLNWILSKVLDVIV